MQDNRLCCLFCQNFSFANQKMLITNQITKHCFTNNDCDYAQNNNQWESIGKFDMDGKPITQGKYGEMTGLPSCKCIEQQKYGLLERTLETIFKPKTNMKNIVCRQVSVGA